jgi:hypothetical protein
MMRNGLILGVLALSLCSCSSSSNPVDAGIDGIRRDRSAIPDYAAGDLGTDQKKDAGKASCPSTVAAAETLKLTGSDTELAGTLDDPAKSACYYKLTGVKGAYFYVVTTAKTGSDPFDATYVDTVVTLLDGNQQPIATNDDPTPTTGNDAELFTRLPADGTFYVKVTECHAKADPSRCGPASSITHKGFTVQALLLMQGGASSPQYTFAVADVEPNETSDSAIAIPYVKGTAGYAPSVILGLFESTTDVDVYTIKLPADSPVGVGQRALGYAIPLPWGANGNGSSAPLGKIWIVDPADASHHLAELDASQGEPIGKLSPPLKLDTAYYLYVTRAAGTAGSNEFYYVVHEAMRSNPLESDESGGPKNDTVATAEALSATSASNPNAYYIEGDLSTATDVDYFSAAVPTGLTKNTVNLSCGSQREGSGLRGLRGTVFRSDGTTLLAADSAATESATDRLLLQSLPLGTETSKVVLKLEATQARDANITGTYWRCALYFQ